MFAPKNIFIATLVAAVALLQPALAQTKKSPAKKTVAAKPAAGKSAGGYQKLPSGLEYKVIKHGTGTRKPVLNDHIEMYIFVHVGDSVIFDSRKMYGPKPVPFPITQPKFKGDPIEGFMLMVEGDSAIFRLPVDSMQKAGNQLMPWMKSGMLVEYNVTLMKVRSEAEERKESEENAAKQGTIDDKILQEYFTKNGIKPTKTASGLYYVILKEGSGSNIKAGQNATVFYTGKFMDGKAFDSNTDSSFHHPQPFEVEVGKGRVIKGWDEGLQLLKKGSKAVFYIPSGLAYGATDRNPIPANSILVFEVEISNVAEPVDQAAIDDKLLQDYFKEKNIQPTKTKSGLYYMVSRKGAGPNAKPGKKVTMNYTGKTLNGTVFDSNTDPQFKHVQPFSFTLGMGQVIPGWDEGVQLLQIGSKATFFIPSGLAYGPRAAGPNIPANTVLLFDVEVVGIDN